VFIKRECSGQRKDDGARGIRNSNGAYGLNIVRRWHNSEVRGGGLDSCGSGNGCVIFNTVTRIQVTWKGKQLTSWATINLWTMNPLYGAAPRFSRSSNYLHEGDPRVMPRLLKQRCRHRKFFISCSVCICHCFVVAATGRTDTAMAQSLWRRPQDYPAPFRPTPGSHCFLCNVNRVSVPQEKRPGRKAERPPCRMVQLQLYLPSVTSWHVTGQPLPLLWQQFMRVTEINTAQDEAFWLHFELKIRYRNF
jgi:hypothetical protein